MPAISGKVTAHFKYNTGALKEVQLSEESSEEHQGTEDDASVSHGFYKHDEVEADCDAWSELLFTEVLDYVQDHFFNYIASMPPFLISFDHFDISRWILPQIAMDHLVNFHVCFLACCKEGRIPPCIR